MKLYYDFHIHSCLSPCGAEDMTPANIANMAALCGLDVIAVADHNSVGNCGALLSAAKRAGILALPAMELCTQEEVHVLCLFPNLRSAETFGAKVNAKLPPIRTTAAAFGRQVYMDDGDRELREEAKLLVNATGIGIYDAEARVRAAGGIALPAHIGRLSFSLLSNLGFWDEEMGFRGVEHSRDSMPGLAEGRPEILALPSLVNSDAHDLGSIQGREAWIEAEERTAEAVFAALKKRFGT
jgi:predicted metal-dependent phosphoesterase TrpH